MIKWLKSINMLWSNIDGFHRAHWNNLFVSKYVYLPARLKRYMGFVHTRGYTSNMLEKYLIGRTKKTSKEQQQSQQKQLNILKCVTKWNNHLIKINDFALSNLPAPIFASYYHRSLLFIAYGWLRMKLSNLKLYFI